MARLRRSTGEFGEALAAALAERGWTQRDLGEALGGVTQSAISAWRSGLVEPAPQTVFAIEAALRAPPGTLSRHLGYLPSTPAQAVDVLRAIEADPFLTDTEKRAVLALYRELRRDRRAPVDDLPASAPSSHLRAVRGSPAPSRDARREPPSRRG